MNGVVARFGHDLLRPAKITFVLRDKKNWLNGYAKSLRNWKASMPPLFASAKDYREGKKAVYEDAQLSEFERLKRAFETVRKLAAYA